MDEHFVVPFAVGFLDCDFNPHWFGYHTLPMYIIASLYAVLYSVYELAGLVHSKVEFASLLFRHDAIFYVSARLLISLIHTTGVCVLALIIKRHYRSTLGAFLVFIAGILIPDSVLASNWIRVDSFVFFFLCLLILFSCYSSKSRQNFVFSLIACAAAIASKIPAIVLFPVLLLALLIDIRQGHYPKIYLVYGVIGVPLLAVLFMPYAVLDFESYKAALHQIFARAHGKFAEKIATTYYQGTWSKLVNLLQLVAKQVGVGTVVGAALAGIYAIARRDLRLLLTLLYTLAYTIAFATSASVDSYWLRPVYPLYIFLTVAFVIGCARTDRYAALLANIDQHFRNAGQVSRFGSGVPLLLLLVYFTFLARPGAASYIQYLSDTRSDTRVEASRWIEENLPADSIVVLDTLLPHYLPRVFSANPMVTFRGFDYVYADRNQLLIDGFNRFFQEKLETAKRFRVGYLNAREFDFDLRDIKVPGGAYIVISSSAYSRYYYKQAMQNDPAQTQRARRYYAIIRRLEPIRKFTGKGPKIEIYRVPLGR